MHNRDLEEGSISPALQSQNVTNNSRKCEDWLEKEAYQSKALLQFGENETYCGMYYKLYDVVLGYVGIYKCTPQTLE